MSNNWMIDFYKNQDVFIVAGGASLFGFDFKKLENKNVLSINHSFRYVKTDILFCLDAKFVRETKNLGFDILKMSFKIIAGTGSGLKNGENVSLVNMTGNVSKNPSAMYGRSQTGLVALNFSLIAGAKNIYLLGFDGKFTNGMGHFYSKDWKHSQDGNENQYKKILKCYEKYRPYKNIYNLNLDSNFDMFQKIKLNSVL